MRLVICLTLLGMLWGRPGFAQGTRPAQDGGAAGPVSVDLANPSRITLHLQDASPKAAFAQLSQQAATNLRPYPPNLWESRTWPPVKVDLDNASFWQALRELCGQTGLSLHRLGAQRDPVLMASGGRSLWEYPAVEHGPFLIFAQSIRRLHTANLSQAQPVQRVCTIQLLLYVEPRIALMKAANQAEITQAIDEKGQALAPAGAGGALVAATSGIWPLTATFSTPPQAGSRLVRLEGRIRTLVQSTRQLVEVPEVLKAANVTRAVGGHRLEVRSVRVAGETYTFQISILPDPQQPKLWEGMNLASTFRLVDAQGRGLTLRNSSGGGEADRIDLNLTFGREDWGGGEGAGEPARLIWDVPLQLKELAIPFQFTDLPLP